MRTTTMMTMIAATVLFQCLGGVCTVNAAFIISSSPHPGRVSGTTRSTRTSSITLLSSSSSFFSSTPERVKLAGGGIPIIPSGDCQLFDPAKEGKLAGTDDLATRLRQGAAYRRLDDPASASFLRNAPPPAGTVIQDAQHWLEDIGIPLNTYKPTQPGTATVLGRVRLITPDAPGDIQHIVLRLPPDFRYVEGQSISITPPGVDGATGKPYKPRLYSIASTRYGDLLDGTTVSLCVRRAEYTDPTTGQVDPSKKGICSNFLCDSTPGTTVAVAGPVGKTMLLPDNPNRDIIMVATGTGIAPFRAFLHRLFMENTLARHLYTGRAWLILGVPVTGGLLYTEELQTMQQNARYPGQLEVTYAISREMTNARGGKMYVQDVLTERANELWDRLEKGAVIYFCGLRGMMPGILDALAQVSAARGVNWADKLKQLQANHQWHVEVY